MNLINFSIILCNMYLSLHKYKEGKNIVFTVEISIFYQTNSHVYESLMTSQRTFLKCDVYSIYKKKYDLCIIPPFFPLRDQNICMSFFMNYFKPRKHAYHTFIFRSLTIYHETIFFHGRKGK